MAEPLRPPPDEILTNEDYDDFQVDTATVYEHIPDDGLSEPQQFSQDSTYMNEDTFEIFRKGEYELQDEKPLQTVHNNGRGEVEGRTESQSAGAKRISDRFISFKDAFSNFQGSTNHKSATPKPTNITRSSSVHSGSSTSSTENYPPLSSSRPEKARRRSSVSAKDMPLPPLPGEADYENVKDKAQKAIEASEVDEESELVYARCSSVQLMSQPWYHGSIDRNEAVRKVMQLKEDGSFLVRDSTTSDIQPYTLVLLYNNVVKNLRIRKSTQGRLILGDEECDNITFEDVTQLVEYHQQCDILLLQEKAKVKLRNTPRKT